MLARHEKVSAIRHWRAWVVAVLLLAPLLAVPARVQAIASPATPREWVETSCIIAQWKAGRILGTYDITEQTYQGVREQARGVSFSVELTFPEVATFRARIRSLGEQVCNAADPQAAGKALDGLEAGRKEVLQQFQKWTGVSDAMKKAWPTLSARTTEQMKPFVAQAKARNQQASANEWQRILKTDANAQGLAKRIIELKQYLNSPAANRLRCLDQTQQILECYEIVDRLNAEAQKEIQEKQAQLTRYIQGLIKPFVDQLKQQTQAQFQAKAAELRKPDEDRLKAIGTLFKEMRQEQDAFAAAGKAEYSQVWKQVVQKRKDLYLKDVDAKIALVKQKIEEVARALTPQQREARGFTNLLAAIDQARQDLAPALEGALTKKDSKAVKEALDTFYRRWAEAGVRQMCTSATPKLLASRDWATRSLEKLRARTPQTPQVQAAVAVIQTWVRDIETAEQLCSAQPVALVQQVREAMAKTVQDAAEVKKAIEALKAGAQKP